MITKEAVERIIRAARTADHMAFHIHAISGDDKFQWTEADAIRNLLVDSLVLMTEGSMKNVSGVQLNATERRDYLQKELHNDVAHPGNTSIGKLADIIMDGINEAQQPTPNLITRESFDEMWKRAGGYLYKAVSGDDSR